jgi:hypothetical protein
VTRVYQYSVPADPNTEDYVYIRADSKFKANAYANQNFDVRDGGRSINMVEGYMVTDWGVVVDQKDGRARYPIIEATEDNND